MFDRYHFQSGPKYTKTEVTENRAPTDESIRLLREMEEEARKNVIRAMVPEGNTVKGVVVERERCPNVGENEIRGYFRLNGKEYFLDIAEPNGRDFYDQYEWAHELVKRISEQITRKIMCEFLGQREEAVEEG